MSIIRISMNQINTKVGSLDLNTKKIVEKISEAEKKNCDIICFPELSITGYPPEDLVLSNQFIENNKKALNEIIESTRNITAIIGFIEIDLAPNGWNADAIAIAANARHNAANKMTGLFMLSCAKPKRV